MTKTNSETTACVCGTCGTASGQHYEPIRCRGCGADFAQGAPLAIVRTTVHGTDEIAVRPWVEFLGRWRPERRRQVEDAIAPKREPLRLLQGGQ